MRDWSELVSAGQAEEERLIQPGAEMASEDLTTEAWCLQGGNRSLSPSLRQWPQTGKWEK